MNSGCKPPTDVEHEIARVLLLWFDGEEGNGPDEAEGTIYARHLKTTTPIAVDLDVIECELRKGIGRFSISTSAARGLAKALIDAADEVDAERNK